MTKKEAVVKLNDLLMLVKSLRTKDFFSKEEFEEVVYTARCAESLAGKIEMQFGTEGTSDDVFSGDISGEIRKIIEEMRKNRPVKSFRTGSKMDGIPKNETGVIFARKLA